MLDAVEILSGLEPSRIPNPRQITLTDDESSFVVMFPYRPAVVFDVKLLPLRKFDEESKHWIVPVSTQNLQPLIEFARKHSFRFRPAAYGRAHRMIEGVSLRVDGSRALDAELHIPGWTTNPDHQLRGFQKADVVYGKHCDGRFIDGDEQGLGKAQPLDAKLLTPTGWRTMGEIKINDLVVHASGKWTQVTGIYPRGVRPVYRVVFSDGSSTECDLEHLWSVNSNQRKRRGYKPRVLTLAEIQKRLPSDRWGHYGERQFCIPLIQAAELNSPEAPYPLDPYLLGLLLGDGSFSGGSVGYTTVDLELVEAIRAVLPAGVKIKRGKAEQSCDWDITTGQQGGKPNPVMVGLRTLGLAGHCSPTKFVPRQYLFAPPLDRIAILQGLLDTDGTVEDGGGAGFGSSSRQLVEDVIFIVQSLGGVARRRKPKRTPNLPHFRVGIKLPPHIKPFRLSRQLRRWRPPTKYLPNRIIKTIEFVADKKVQCIRVSAPDGLYVTDECIVTHNSPTGLAVLEQFNAFPAVICTMSSLKYQWAAEVEKFLPSRTCTVIDLDEEPDYKADIAIINYDILKLPPEWYEDRNRTVPPAVRKLMTAKWYGERELEVPEKVANGEYRYLDKLIDRKNKGIIFDEIQLLKSEKSQRSLACAELAEFIEKPDVRIGLSGTIVLNRPIELVQPLRLINKLQDMGGFWHFTQTFCGAESTLHGWNFRGATAVEELNAKLREVCLRKGTLVDTEYGKLPIDLIVEQRLPVKVWSRSDAGKLELKKIVGFSKSLHRGPMAALTFSNGAKVICTPDHKIWTAEGYRHAGLLTDHDQMLALPKTANLSSSKPLDSTTLEILLSALCRNRAQSKQTCSPQDGSYARFSTTTRYQQALCSAILQRSCARPEYDVCANAPILLRTLFQSMAQLERKTKTKPETPTAHTTTFCGSTSWQTEPITRHKTQTTYSSFNRERSSYLVSTASNTATRGANLAICDRPAKSTWLSEALDRIQSTSKTTSQVRTWDVLSVDRSSSSTIEYCDRDRWFNAQAETTKADRSLENQTTKTVRLERLTFLEPRCGSTARYDRDDGEYVYDIEVEDNHNFFANGVLVSNCYIRHDKKEVYPELPPVQPVIVPMRISNQLEYKRAAKDFIAYIRDTRGDDAAKRMKKAQSFAKLEVLKQLAVTGMMESIENWVKDFIEANDEKLIIFAHHIPAQQALLKMVSEALKAKDHRLKATSLFAADKRHIEANKAQFQNDPWTRVIVVSEMSGGTGHNLTAATNILICELPWTPSAFDQMVARAYGRISDMHGVNVYVPLGIGTIYYPIWKFVESKRLVTTGVISGKKGITADDVKEELIRLYAKEAA
jgi:Intein splicing domain/LAGLIDADG-like domain